MNETTAARCPASAATPHTPPDEPGLRPAHVADTAAPEAPVVDWVDPTALQQDPYPTYRRLRAEAPVAWVPRLNRYLVTSYAACKAMEDDPESPRAGTENITRSLGGVPMLAKTGAAHTAERAALNPALRPKCMQDVWEPVFTRNAHRYLDVLTGIGPERADLHRDYAVPLAARNLADLLGMRDVPAEQLARWSQAFISEMANGGKDPDVTRRAAEAGAEADAVLDDLVPRLRSCPDDSVVSTLAAGGMGVPEIHHNVKLIISGGVNEPQHALTTLFWALDGNPEQRAEILAEPRLWRTAFDEAIRLVAPIGMIPKTLERDTVLGGVRLLAGRDVGLMISAANRDPSRFPDPDSFDLHRPKVAHLAFGAGVHMCAGLWAARWSIGQIAVPLLYERHPDVRIDPSRRTRWAGWFFRGMTECPIAWTETR
ncbi:cytochrome P450 [Streptomyces sp. NPDC048288]|uniref:cytochrome P450 n=1 Tax=Streptomyces sp. NPDC048288 TaxID=3365529 RepID=UPI00371196DB